MTIHLWPTHRRAASRVHPLPAPQSRERAHVERLRKLQHAGRKPYVSPPPVSPHPSHVVLKTPEPPRGYRSGSVPCACGTIVCSKRGPCAPREPAKAIAAPPVPVGAPASDPWAVGRKVRCVEGAHTLGSRLVRGETYVIRGVDYDSNGLAYLLLEGDDNQGGWLRDRFKPIAPAPEERAEWTPEACGWTRTEQNGFVGYVYGASRWTTGVPRVERNVTSSRGWYHGNARHGTGHTLIGNPSLALACCAALGIEIDRDEDERLYTPFLNGNCIAPGIFVTAEDAARAALQAHHQQAGRP